jgi:hypothetical protein
MLFMTTLPFLPVFHLKNREAFLFFSIFLRFIYAFFVP